MLAFPALWLQNDTDLRDHNFANLVTSVKSRESRDVSQVSQHARDKANRITSSFNST